MDAAHIDDDSTETIYTTETIVESASDTFKETPEGPQLVGVSLFYDRKAISDEVLVIFENLKTVTAIKNLCKDIFVHEMQENSIPAHAKFFGLTCVDPHGVLVSHAGLDYCTIVDEEEYSLWRQRVEDTEVRQGELPYIQVCLYSEDRMIEEGRELDNWFETEALLGVVDPATEIQGAEWDMRKVTLPENPFINEETCEMTTDYEKRILCPRFRALPIEYHARQDTEYRAAVEKTEVEQSSHDRQFAALKEEAAQEAIKDDGSEELFYKIKDANKLLSYAILSKKGDIVKIKKDIMDVKKRLG